KAFQRHRRDRPAGARVVEPGPDARGAVVVGEGNREGALPAATAPGAHRATDFRAKIWGSGYTVRGDGQGRPEQPRHAAGGGQATAARPLTSRGRAQTGGL